MIRKGHPRWLVRATLTAALLASSPALHAEPTVADKESARAAWTSGVQKRNAGDHAAALKLFQAAHAIMGLATTGLEVARETAETGQIVEARDLALSAAKSTSAVPAEKAAAAEAQKLYEALGKRVGTILLVITGPREDAVRATVDGVAVLDGALAAPRVVNPGKHRIIAKAPGFEPVERVVTLTEGAFQRVEIRLEKTKSRPRETIPDSVLAMIDKYVVLTKKDDTDLEGRLISADDTGFVLEGYDHAHVTVPRKEARGVHLREGDEAKEPAPPVRREAPKSAPRERDVDGLEVHIDSNDSGVLLYRDNGTDKGSVQLGGLSFSGSPNAFYGGGTIEMQRREFICRAPCDVPVDAKSGAPYYLAVDNEQLGPSFLLRGLGSQVVLRAQVKWRPSSSDRTLGILFFTVGAAAGLVSLGVAVGLRNTPNIADGVLALAIGGAVGVGAGVGLYIKGAGSYKVTVPHNLESALLPTSIAATPPLPLPSGASAGGLSATWQF